MRLDELKTPERAHDSDAVEGWLRVLKELLHLPESKSAGICEELEMHLRERIRDLQVAGMNEQDAIRTAIGELGDAAVLAGRFRSASRWKHRRLSMNIAVATVAGTAAVLSIVAVSRAPQGVPMAAADEPPTHTRLELQVRTEVADEMMLLRVEPVIYQDAADGRGKVVGEIGEGTITLETLFERLGERLEAKVHVRWPRLEVLGVHADSTFTIVGRDLDLPTIFAMINEEVEFGRLDYRVRGGVLEIADPELFDMRERVLVTYDIGPVLADGRKRFEQTRDGVLAELLGTLHQFVSPDAWADNGGTLASNSIIGDRLFVEAPPRMHRQIEWVLAQLPAVAAAEPRAGERREDGRVVKLYPLRFAEAGATVAALEGQEALRDLDFRRLKLDPRTNSLILQGSDEEHRRVAAALQAIDLAP